MRYNELSTKHIGKEEYRTINIVAKNLEEFKPALTFVISFFTRYIGSSLLKRCGIHKVCDSTAAAVAVDYDYVVNAIKLE